MTPAPEGCTPTSALGDGDFFIHIKPGEEGILGAWFPPFSFPQADLQGPKRSNLYPDMLKDESQDPLLP